MEVAGLKIKVPGLRYHVVASLQHPSLALFCRQLALFTGCDGLSTSISTSTASLLCRCNSSLSP